MLDDAEPDPDDPNLASGDDDGDDVSTATMKAIAEYVGGRIGVNVKEE